jgi:NAD(P)-dependent dehydrogenase (short-subunit alcohol dehydrogenase family)
LAGQQAVVVGGAQGIGRAIADQFRTSLSNVSIWDIHPAVDDAPSEAATEQLGGLRFRRADVTAEETLVAGFADLAASTTGPLHVVYAAGAGSGKFGFPFWNLQPDDWPRVLDINLTGAVRAAQAAAPLLTERGGTLLFISSIAGQIGSQTDPPYSAAKAGLINFAQCAAKDLAAFDVRVNTICPGMIKTTLNRAVWEAWSRQAGLDAVGYDEWAGEKVRQVAPLGRWQEPQDIGALAAFLASPLAKNITGQTLNVDGGQVMQ